jgi:3-oxoacyl-[acyl-carrier protein] reductase
MYSDKVILITGTSRGVGLEIAMHFLNLGGIVIGISRTSGVISHNNYTHYSVDLSNQDDIVNCFKNQVSRNFSSIDIIINNAAMLTSQFSMIMPLKNAIEMVNVNLMAVFLISRESVKLMRRNNFGRIINIGSMASSLEPMGDSIYAATKSACITLTNVMAKEFSHLNITCNTLSITAIETDMFNSHSEIAKDKIAKIIQNLPIPRIAKIDDILNVIDFFASERSSYITAQTIYLGGIN